MKVKRNGGRKERIKGGEERKEEWRKILCTVTPLISAIYGANYSVLQLKLAAKSSLKFKRSCVIIFQLQ